MLGDQLGEDLREFRLRTVPERVPPRDPREAHPVGLPPDHEIVPRAFGRHSRSLFVGGQDHDTTSKAIRHSHAG